MSRHKTQSFKEKLIKAAKQNERTPVWVILRTKTRDWAAKGKRNWRFNKLKATTKHKTHEERRLRSLKKTRDRQRKTSK